jgi:hypothetical protein
MSLDRGETESDDALLGVVLNFGAAAAPPVGWTPGPVLLVVEAGVAVMLAGMLVNVDPISHG